jgi:hypothetical protein
MPEALKRDVINARGEETKNSIGISLPLGL